MRPCLLRLSLSVLGVSALLLLLVSHLHRRYPGRLRLPGIIHLKSSHGS